MDKSLKEVKKEEINNKNGDDEIIYKIDHYYNIDHDEQCLLIKSDIGIEHLIKILAAIHFKFEELIDESVCVDEMHILDILKMFYGVVNVKEQYKKYLPYTQLVDHEWDITNYFYIHNNDIKLKIIQIDIYEARESCCGPNYKKVMKEVLPHDPKFEAAINKTKAFYKNINNR